MQVNIGCSGWFYWHWKGKFYPDELPQNEWFKFYTTKFNTVELNSTFYRFPKLSTARGWYRNSPKGFIYTLKVNKTITHIKKFNAVKSLIKEFYKVGEELKDKLGCFLFQLPPSLKFGEKKLEEIISQLDLEKRNALEFRDISWFTENAYKKLKENKIMFCTVSCPKLPDKLVKTSDGVYIRFHGKGGWYSSDYSDDELKDWKDKIKKSKAKQVWAYFNNDFNANATRNALSLKKLLRKV